MTVDPIVEQVRQTRRDIERECGDRAGYLRLLREIERDVSTDRLVRQRPASGRDLRD